MVLGPDRTEPEGPALGSAHLPVVLGPVTLVPAVQVSSGTLPLAFLSTVEYPLQLLHSPPAPVVKRPGVATHHPLQVLPCPLRGVPSPAELLPSSSALILSLLASLGRCFSLTFSPSPVCPTMGEGVSFFGVSYSLTFWVPRSPPSH